MIESEILRLKEEKDALLLAHNYQPAEILKIADLSGDSLELSRAAAKVDCSVIVFCGVRFMAETAAIISPEKTILLTDATATCPMADMITESDVKALRKEHPNAAVVCYVNSSAEVKAQSDICCTSANGVKVVNSLSEDEIIFVPDRNLASYVARYTKKTIYPWDGFCYVHDRYTRADVLKAKAIHPDAELLVHPECPPDVIDMADGVFSTSGMLKYAKESDCQQFIIGTEVGMLYRLSLENPQKKFYPLNDDAICQDMKKTNLEKVLSSIQNMEHVVRVQPDVANRARSAIERMLKI